MELTGNYRHELKYQIGPADHLALRQRLKAVMQQDLHTGADGRYTIRSVYFDNYRDKALRDKINGVSRREKFRLRCYNGDASYLVLEKKSKIGGLCAKEQCCLTRPQTEALLAGDTQSGEADAALLRELHRRMQTEGLRPKTIVDYTREPFIFAPGVGRISARCDPGSGADPLHPQRGLFQVRGMPGVWIT